MRGRIKDFSHQQQRGIIEGDDGSEYAFSYGEWDGHGLPMAGMPVEFETQGRNAISVVSASGAMWDWLSVGPGERSRAVSGVLAVFTGYLGIHKLYMGKPGAAILHLMLTGGGVFLWAVPNLVLQNSPGQAFFVCLLGWAAAFCLYFGARKFYLRHSTDDILRPLRFLLWPLRLFRLPRSIMRRAMEAGEEEEQYRRLRRRRQRRRGRFSGDDDDDDDGCSRGCLLWGLAGALFLTIAGGLLILLYILTFFVGFVVVGASIAIGVAEGLIYMKRSDTEFDDIYLAQGRSWF